MKELHFFKIIKIIRNNRYTLLNNLLNDDNIKIIQSFINFIIKYDFTYASLNIKYENAKKSLIYNNSNNDGVSKPDEQASQIKNIDDLEEFFSKELEKIQANRILKDGNIDAFVSELITEIFKASLPIYELWEAIIIYLYNTYSIDVQSFILKINNRIKSDDKIENKDKDKYIITYDTYLIDKDKTLKITNMSIPSTFYLPGTFQKKYLKYKNKYLKLSKK
jgi:hypothetical protein